VVKSSQDATMVKQSNIFRLFVSSTFRDFQQERDALQQDVFPRLREYCRERKASFQGVDLRWGISQEAGQEQRTLDICLNEITRCQDLTRSPNFLLLSGYRYGWCPLPVRIPADEWDVIIKHVSAEDKSLLANWYRRDDNAVPPNYVLQPNHGVENWWDDGDALGIESQLHRILVDAVVHTSLSPQQRIKYEKSATEQEIHAGIFDNPDAEHATITFIRDISNLPNTPNDYYEDDASAQANIAELRERLADYNPHHLTAEFDGEQLSQAYINAFAEQVYEAIRVKIDAEQASQEALSDVDIERNQHQAFLAERSQHFVGREDVLAKVDAYLQSDSNQPYVVHGQSGIGKTSIMGQVVKRHPDAIYRFIGATPTSSSIQQLITNICTEINQRTGQGTEIPYDYDELVEAFSQFLEQARDITIILDAVDQLSDFNAPFNLRWLPRELPQGVRFVVSTIPGAYLTALRQRLPVQNFYTVHPMDYDTASHLLDAWLANAGRALQPQQREEVLTKFEHNALPLYLKLAFEEARLWHSYTPKITLATEVQSLLRDNLFARLGEASQHGEALIRYSMAYLSAARYGLTEREIRELLACNDDYWTYFLSTAHEDHNLFDRQLPVIVWSRLALDLEPYLIQRSVDDTLVFDFYHRQFSEVVDAIFLEPVRQATHTHLSDYYVEELVTNQRKLSELPYQLAHAERYEVYMHTLVDLPFIEAKLIAIGNADLRQDCTYLPTDCNDTNIRNTVRIMRSFWDVSNHILGDPDNYAQLYNQLIGRLGLHEDKQPEIGTLLKHTRHTAENHPIPQLILQQPTLEAAGTQIELIVKSPDYLLRNVTQLFDETLLFWGGANLYICNTEGVISNRLDPLHIVEGTLPLNDGRILFWGISHDLGIWIPSLSQHIRLSGHEDFVRGAIQLKDENILSWSSDNTLRIWSKIGSPIHKLEGHSEEINGALQLQNRSILSWAGARFYAKDNALRIWSVDGELVATLKGHSDKILGAIQLRDANILTWSRDDSIRIWSPRGNAVTVFCEQIHGLNGVMQLHDDRILAWTNDGNLFIWSCEGILRSRFTTHVWIQNP
jgi:WD40 repeat protein